MSRETEPRRSGRLRAVLIGAAALLMIVGVVSLILSLSRHAREDRAAKIAELKQTIASEEAERSRLQADYDSVLATLTEKQTEYEAALQQSGAGITPEAQEALDRLREAAEQTQQDYTAALEAYDAAVDAVEKAEGDDAYAAALEASEQAAAALGEAHAAMQTAANAYDAAKSAQTSSADWRADREQEIASLEQRLQELERSMNEVSTALAGHRAELKKLEH